ncbi:MAG: flagellar biosynthesis protein FlgL, partial [Rhizobiales bacterium]|nr:flagellar biosynthesis protein FlgL [Hyphomicrobiales bacterium]
SSTSADTVYWYTGELASGSARDSVTARIDNQMSVNYGIRANEDGIRSLVQSVAVYAATSFDPADATATNASGALVDRVRTAMSGSPSMQTIDEIATDIGSAQAAVKAAQDRQKQTGNVLNGLIDQAEGISTEEAATSILALQTRLQASLQTTAALYKMSLTNYI